MSVLEDERIVSRLRHRPEFLLRLDEFAFAYGLHERPALIAQARPNPETRLPALDVDDATLQQRFLEGSGTQPAWWDGFRSRSRAKPTFHGIAGLSSWEEPTWSNEMHVDGHFIAGVWSFPDLPSSGGTQVPVIADFYCGFFDDFCNLVTRILDQSGVKQDYELTATLLGAQKLHFAKLSSFGGQYVIGATPLGTSALQWPVLACGAPGSPSWIANSKFLGRALTGTYGALPPRTA